MRKRWDADNAEARLRLSRYWGKRDATRALKSYARVRLQQTLAGVRYGFSLTGTAYRIFGCILTLNRPAPVRLLIRRQGPLDRMAIRSGIATPYAFDDPSFEARVFVECDDPAFVDRILGREDQRALCLALMDERCGSILFDHHGVAATFESYFPGLPASGQSLEDRVKERADVQAERLAALARELPVAPLKPLIWRRTGRGWQLLPLMAVLAAYIWGSQGWLRGQILPTIPVVKLYLAFCLGAATLAGVRLLLKKHRSAPHPRALAAAILVFSLLAALLPGIGYLNRVTGSDGDGTLVVTEVIGRDRSDFRGRIPAFPRVEVRDWRDRLGGVWFSVDKPGYLTAASPGRSCVRFEIGKGGLGLGYYRNLKVYHPAPGFSCHLDQAVNKRS